MNARVTVLCSVTCVLGLVMAVDSSPLDKHQRELKEHYDHLALIADFKCHDPQRRAIPIAKLLPEPETRGKAFFPDVTVLGRCDCESGTCLAGHQCASAHIEPLMLPVKATFLHDTNGHKKGSWQIEYYQFDNHTACSCVPIPPSQPAEQGKGHGGTESTVNHLPEGPNTVRVIHEHYIVPSSEIQQYQEVLASLPAIEQTYDEHIRVNLPEQSDHHQPQDTVQPTRLCIPPSCK